MKKEYKKPIIRAVEMEAELSVCYGVSAANLNTDGPGGEIPFLGDS